MVRIAQIRDRPWTKAIRNFSVVSKVDRRFCVLLCWQDWHRETKAERKGIRWAAYQCLALRQARDPDQSREKQRTVLLGSSFARDHALRLSGCNFHARQCVSHFESCSIWRLCPFPVARRSVRRWLPWRCWPAKEWLAKPSNSQRSDVWPD